MLRAWQLNSPQGTVRSFRIESRRIHYVNHDCLEVYLSQKDGIHAYSQCITIDYERLELEIYGWDHFEKSIMLAMDRFNTVLTGIASQTA
jgi:hypothetical protein